MGNFNINGDPVDVVYVCSCGERPRTCSVERGTSRAHCFLSEVFFSQLPSTWKMAVFSTLKGTLSWIRLGAREAGTMTSQAVRKHPGASLSAATTIFGLFTATYVSFMILIVFFYIENYPSLFIICLCRYIMYSNRPLSAIDQLDERECLFRESEKQVFKAMLREPKLWVIAVSGPPDAGLWTSSHLLLSFSLHKKKRFMRTAFFRSCSLSVPV